VNKVLQYEKTPFTNPNIDWYKRGVVAANDAYVSQKDTKRKVRQKLLDYGNFTNVDTFYVENGAQKSQFIASFVSGVGYVNYRGEGWVDGWSAMNFGVSDANNLTVNGMTPIVTSIGCGVAQFNGGSDCLGQALIFRGTGTNTGTNLGGATAFCGPTWNTHTSWNNKTDLGLYNAMFQLHHDHLASAYLYGKMYMFSILGNNITTETAFNQYLIFGDAELNIRTTTPKAVSILTSSTVVANSTLNVIVNETTGTPLGGIRVCAYTSDGSVYFVDETNNVGELAIQVGNATLGSTLYVTVSGKNIIPVQQTYTITNPAQFVSFTQISVNDATNGNNNGKINPGETVELGIVLHNYGTQTASNVVATLTTNDTLTTILQNSVNYGDILSATAAQPPSNFILQIDPDFVEYHAISLLLSITDGTNTWTEPINIALGTPSLVIENVIIEDNSTFHPNSLDPGENATIKVVLKNQGWGSAQNFSGILITGNSNVSITDFNATYDLTLEPDSTGGSSISDAFQVTVPANFPIETSVEFTLYIASGTGSSYPYSFALPFSLTIGQLFPNDPSLADAYGYSMIENVDTNILEAPTFNWVEIATPSGGPGTQIAFNTAVSDQTLVQNLPFPFKFYGNTFNQISVSTDGFAMLGSNTANQWQNQDLPYADNLTNMVCPFWTDLWDNQNGESGRVYKYYDTTNHIFIIEWYQLHHYSGTPNPAETFQIILKDPAFYTTVTGDGEILFQYQNIDLTKQEYTTVGLENATQTIGIQYKGKNSISNSSTGLESGRAILFTTNPPTVVSAEDKNQVATNFKLAQNYPNPFNPSTKIDFSIPSREKVELEIFNVLGQQVKTLVSKSLPSGNHSILWNGTDKNGNLVSSGIYFYRIKAGDFTQTRKMTFLK
ncbi:T9SS type A sorting domain-containing protein, partial [bacterium]|nr:T9SS type A sorting domain-containing protein [bacterium]